MMSPTTHPLLADYLARLRVAADRLPAEDAAALVADIEEHIGAATESGRTTEADVRNLIDRLGPPEALVAEIKPPSAPPVAAGSSRRFEAPVVTLLFVAELFAISLVGVGLGAIAWIVGVVLIALCVRWTSAEKLRAALILGTGYPVTALGILLGGLVAFRTSGGSCTGSSGGTLTCTDDSSGQTWLAVVAVALFVGYVVLQIVTARRLLRAAR